MGGLFGGGGSHETVRHVGVSPEELARVREDVAKEKERADKLMKMLGDRKGEFAQMQKTLTDNEQRRAAEQRQMADEMAKTREAHASDKLKQAEEMEKVRKSHQIRFDEMEGERKRDKQAFQSQVAAAKKQSEATVKRMSIEKLTERIGFLLPFVCAERRKLEVSKAAYWKQAEAVSTLKADIKKETLRLSAFLDARHDENCLRIVLYGETGHGKSSTGCRLVGDTSADYSKGGFPVSHKLDSETQTISGKLLSAADSARLGYDHSILVVDLPGAGDTGGVRVDRRHSNRMVQYLKGIGFINAIALVHNGSVSRMPPVTCAMLDALHKSFGAEIWSHVILVVTHIRCAEDYRDSERARRELAEASKWVAALQTEIRKRYSLPEYVLLDAVCIDNNYLPDAVPKCRKLVNSYVGRYKHTAFKCDALVSPLDAWRCQLQLKENELNEKEKEVSLSVDGVNAVVAQIKRCTAQLSQKIGTAVDLRSLCGEYRVDAANVEEIKMEDILQSATESTADDSITAEPEPGCVSDESDYKSTEETTAGAVHATAVGSAMHSRQSEDEQMRLAIAQSLATAGTDSQLRASLEPWATVETSATHHTEGGHYGLPIEDASKCITAGASAAGSGVGDDSVLSSEGLSEDDAYSVS